MDEDERESILKEKKEKKEINDRKSRKRSKKDSKEIDDKTGKKRKHEHEKPGRGTLYVCEKQWIE